MAVWKISAKKKEKIYKININRINFRSADIKQKAEISIIFNAFQNSNIPFKIYDT